MANRSKGNTLQDDFKEVLTANRPREETEMVGSRRPNGGPSPAQPVAVHLGCVPSAEVSADHGRCTLMQVKLSWTHADTSVQNKCTRQKRNTHARVGKTQR